MKDYRKENISFVMKTELHAGDGIAKSLPDHLQKYKWNNIGVIIDKGLYKNNSYVKDIISLLDTKLVNVLTVINEMAEPTYDYLDELKLNFKDKKIDCFVGIGGGSTLDITKGLATLQTNKQKAINYRGMNKVTNIPLPVVALPSTAGTGSEVTPYAVFIDTEQKWKFGINSDYNYPRLAFYDSRFLDSCPTNIYASSGMDAMTHTLESYAAKNATTLSRSFSEKAFHLLFPNLKKISKNDRSTDTKLNLLVGSGCAGIALMNSGAGPSGALSYPLGVYFDVPHGLAGSVFLPPVIKYNVEQGYEEYSNLYDLIYPNTSKNSKEKSLDFADEIELLSNDLGIPTKLGGFGVKTNDDLYKIIDNAWQLKLAFEQNPVEFGKKQIEMITTNLK